MNTNDKARLAALLDAERENTSLRAEVAYLRACVPPVHPTDYGHEAWTEAVRVAVDAERAAVVAFLRETLAASETAHASDDLDYAIDIIERGEHRREEE